MIQHTKIHRNYTEEKTIYWRHILNFFRNMVRVQRLNGERFRRGTGVCDRTPFRGCLKSRSGRKKALSV
ncbi:hypothetical protein [Nostoc sp.]|uniref:hypothetical protein n=1 Tax=Nostoc sp. TaxID=1180 RepID=UPI002FF49A70